MLGLYVRLLRALWIFGLVFSGYIVQLTLQRATRRIEKDPSTGRERPAYPAWVTVRKRRVDERAAKRVLRGMLRLRGVYIKLGQVLSIMGGFLPRAFTDELKVLQDQVPPRPYAELERAFRRCFGRSPDECFEYVERQPLAAASLGQVHAAWLADGRKVAVKFLYPGIRDVIRTDMRVIRLALRVLRWFFPLDALSKVHQALVDLLRRETDYEHEASCMERMADNHRGSKDLLFPEPIRELTTTDVLTMTFMEGFKITDFDRCDELGISRKRIATRLTQWFYESVFVHRLFHADPHPGNFLIQPPDSPKGKPRIVVLDFGAVCETTEEMVEGMVDVLQGFFEKDDTLVLKGFDRLGFVAEDGNRELVEQTVLTYFRKLLNIKDRTAGALMSAASGDLGRLIDPEVERLEQLRDLMRSVRYPDGWFYIERSAVLAFWLIGQIEPKLDTLQVGFPYVMPLLAKRTKHRSPRQPRKARSDSEADG